MENQIFMGVLQRDEVDFNKNKVSNICTLLFATGIHRYLNFRKLAHVAFCKQTLQFFLQLPIIDGNILLYISAVLIRPENRSVHDLIIHPCIYTHVCGGCAATWLRWVSCRG